MLSMVPDPSNLIESLQLEPHPEGGWYRETWRGAPGPDGRSVGTAIYYLTVAESPSRLHRVDADEVFHWYAGDEVEQLQLGPDGESRVVVLGGDHPPQAVVPAGWWQGSVTRGWALLGCTVSPGFEFSGFELAGPDDIATLQQPHPEHRTLIERLTRGVA